MKHKAGCIVGRSETPSRLVITEEFSQISGSLAIQNLKHVQVNFESYPIIKKLAASGEFREVPGLASTLLLPAKMTRAALFRSLCILARSLDERTGNHKHNRNRV